MQPMEPDMDFGRDIHPLTDFKRNAAEFLTQLKQTGHPLVLTTGSHSSRFPSGEVVHSLVCSRSGAEDTSIPYWLESNIQGHAS
jgi:hypothetical protein